MTEDERIAKQISDLMLEFGPRLDRSARTPAPKIELNVYRSGVDEIMGKMLTEIMNPLYKRHPTLKPKGLR
ncbi:MAG TPA: hypothetical protein VHY36_07895 [Steroidobacteraceae bacterium]|jgi:hypothetical protein|nr:hypothetical protein [Steroidobacteraceae bacterium]